MGLLGWAVKKGANQIKREIVKQKVRNDIKKSDAKFEQERQRLNEADAIAPDDPAAAIAIYEDVIKSADWNTLGFKLKLAKLYQMNGQGDKSWSLLNQLYMNTLGDVYKTDVDKIRYAQFDQLESEGKYKDAIQMLMLYTYSKCVTYSGEVCNYSKTSFINKAKFSARHLSISNGQLSQLADDLGAVFENNPSERAVVQCCRDFMEKNSLIKSGH